VKDLEKIESFLHEHHVMTLATSDFKSMSACSLFYAYDESTQSFIVASADDTLHVKHSEINPSVAGNILLETKSVAKIQGVQLRGVFAPLDDERLKKHYFKTFPYALALLPKLWRIRVDFFKMTDNRLGFAKKIVWEREARSN